MKFTKIRMEFTKIEPQIKKTWTNPWLQKNFQKLSAYALKYWYFRITIYKNLQSEIHFLAASKIIQCFERFIKQEIYYNTKIKKAKKKKKLQLIAFMRKHLKQHCQTVPKSRRFGLFHFNFY